MKILLVSTSFPLNKSSSSGIFIRKLADSLTKKNSITVLTPADNETSAISSNLMYPVICFKYAPSNWSILAHQPGGIPMMIKNKPVTVLLIPFFVLSLFLYTLLISKKHDLIHANWSITGLICGIAARLNRKKIIVTLRGSDVSNIDSSVISRFITYYTLKICHTTITVSSIMAKKITTQWPEMSHKVIHISNGIDNSFYNINTPILNDHKLHLLYIGNLVPNKSVDTIIKALAPLSFNYQLDIVGDGHKRQHLEALCQEYGITSKIIFSGQQPNSEVPVFMEKTDIVIIASFSEGRSNVLLEALASGRLVIASDITANREVIQNRKNGLLFPPGDNNELTQILNTIYDQKQEYKLLGKNAKNNILKQNLTWSETASFYNSVYQTLTEC